MSIALLKRSRGNALGQQKVLPKKSERSIVYTPAEKSPVAALPPHEKRWGWGVPDRHDRPLPQDLSQHASPARMKPRLLTDRVSVLLCLGAL